MSKVASISAISGSGSAPEETILELQAQLLRYSQLANTLSLTASADYKALQNAVNAGNVAEAEVAYALLQRDSKPAESTSATKPEPPPAPQKAGSADNVTAEVAKPVSSLDTEA
jgi:hypothetical protein